MKTICYIKERAVIQRSPELNEALEKLRATFTYTNPMYYKLKHMGKYVGGLSPYTSTYTHITHPILGESISFPRGGVHKIRSILKEYDIELSFIDQRTSLPPIKHLSNNIVLRPDQEKLANIMFKKQNCLIRSPTGSGKCLGPDVEVLMYDGNIKLAKEVVVGDLLMGPDSQPRTVLSTTTGHGNLYEIQPNKGKSWICNKDHVLTLINTSSNKIIDIPLEQYFHTSKTFKHCHKLFMTGVEYSDIHQLPIDPYFLGVWIGDGKKDLSIVEITKDYNDYEIIKCLLNTAQEWGLEVKTYKGKNRSPQHRLVSSDRNNQLLFTLRKLMNNGIRIPEDYLKHSSRNDRLQLLAGIIDTDGYLGLGYFELSQVRKELLDDIQYISHSLGFRTSRKVKYIDGTYYHFINIMGNVQLIPTRIARKQASFRKMNKDARRVGFDTKFIGQGKYCGWTLDGDGRFLLGDFTVTHNTEVALKVVEWILKDAGPVLIVVWETDLMEEWIDRAAKRFCLRTKDIGTLGGGKRKFVAPITIGMQQTLKQCASSYAHNFGGVIADEVQRFAANTYQQVIDVMPAKYRLGITANETRKDSQEYLIYDMFGEVAEEIERATLIDQGKIHDVSIRLIPTNYNFYQYSPSEGKAMPWSELSSEERNFNDLLDSLCIDEERNLLAWQFMEPAFKTGHTILIITHRVSHAEWWDSFLRAQGISCGLMIGGTKNKAEFGVVKQSLRDGKIQAGIGTIKKIGQALDIPRWDRGYILTPCAGNSQQLEQIVGRLRRTHDQKTDAVCYYMFDEKVYPYHKHLIKKQYQHTFLLDGNEFVPV